MSVNLYDQLLAKEIAKSLLSIEAIKIRPESPFTWASGWKSPIYCDNRLSLSHPKIRTQVKESLAKMISEKFPEVECIAGVATAGIPQGALIADMMDLPFIYIRSKSKSHGMGNQIEGTTVANRKVVLVEDLVSTGGSSLLAAEAVRAAGMEVLGMAAIFTYGFGVAQENFDKHDVDLYYLSDYSTLISSMVADGNINKDQEATLQDWRNNPSEWNQ